MAFNKVNRAKSTHPVRVQGHCNKCERSFTEPWRSIMVCTLQQESAVLLQVISEGLELWNRTQPERERKKNKNSHSVVGERAGVDLSKSNAALAQ